jgi:hypothetical protein
MFWVIYFMFCMVERVSALLLSWFPYYYQFKLCVLSWLIFFHGADQVYRRLHSIYVSLRRYAKKSLPERYASIFWEAKQQSEQQYVEELEKYADFALLAQVQRVCLPACVCVCVCLYASVGACVHMSIVLGNMPQTKKCPSCCFPSV